MPDLTATTRPTTADITDEDLEIASGLVAGGFKFNHAEDATDQDTDEDLEVASGLVAGGFRWNHAEDTTDEDLEVASGLVAGGLTSINHAEDIVAR